VLLDGRGQLDAEPVSVDLGPGRRGGLGALGPHLRLMGSFGHPLTLPPSSPDRPVFSRERASACSPVDTERAGSSSIWSSAATTVEDVFSATDGPTADRLRLE
jgi:hypothetical protein